MACASGLEIEQAATRFLQLLRQKEGLLGQVLVLQSRRLLGCLLAEPLILRGVSTAPETDLDLLDQAAARRRSRTRVHRSIRDRAVPLVRSAVVLRLVAVELEAAGAILLVLAEAVLPVLVEAVAVAVAVVPLVLAAVVPPPKVLVAKVLLLLVSQHPREPAKARARRLAVLVVVLAVLLGRRCRSLGRACPRSSLPRSLSTCCSC